MRRSLPAFLAVLLLVLGGSSHMHLRYCLDGQEAPVSVHFELAETHLHEEESARDLGEQDKVDIESELSLDTLFGKLFEYSPDAAPPNSSNLASTARYLHPSILPAWQDVFPPGIASQRPPARAPPIPA